MEQTTSPGCIFKEAESQFSNNQDIPHADASLQSKQKRLSPSHVTSTWSKGKTYVSPKLSITTPPSPQIPFLELPSILILINNSCGGLIHLTTVKDLSIRGVTNNLQMSSQRFPTKMLLNCSFMLKSMQRKLDGTTKYLLLLSTQFLSPHSIIIYEPSYSTIVT